MDERIAQMVRPWTIKRKQEPIYPKRAECLPASEFRICGYKPSAFAPRLMVPDSTQATTFCPSCTDEGPPLVHGDYAKCRNCGLEMQVFGATLHIWR